MSQYFDVVTLSSYVNTSLTCNAKRENILVESRKLKFERKKIWPLWPYKKRRRIETAIYSILWYKMYEQIIFTEIKWFVQSLHTDIDAISLLKWQINRKKYIKNLSYGISRWPNLVDVVWLQRVAFIHIESTCIALAYVLVWITLLSFI